jgi:glycosyltransferase involved in cell wall biosynthesis
MAIMKKYYIVLSPTFPSDTSFRWSFIYDQVKAIKKNSNYDVVVLCPSPWYKKEKDYEFEGIKVHYFNTFDLPSYILPGLFGWLSKSSFLLKLKSIGIDFAAIAVVHAHVTDLGFYANAIKQLYPKVKTVLQHHGFDVLSLTSGKLSKSNWHKKWVKNYGLEICNQIDVHVGVSKQTLKHLSSFEGINLKSTYILYNGVDQEKFYPIAGLKAKNKFTIGCIGNFWEIKDQLTLIKAVEMLIMEGLEDIELVLIGSGELLQLCKSYIVEKKLSNYIVFKSELPHKELCSFYNTLNLFVLPSYYEAFGCVYAEAYACDVPFIGVEEQGIAELILPENKVYQLVPAKNESALSEKIKYFYQNQNFRPKLNQSILIDDLVKNFLNTVTKK